MGYYVIKAGSLPPKTLPPALTSQKNSLFLLFHKADQKVSGIYGLKKEHGRSYVLSPYRLYRRSVDHSFLKNQDLTLCFRNASFTRISRDKFLRIIKVIQQVNFPQMSSDFLFLNMKGDHVETRLLQTYPEIRFLRSRTRLPARDLRLIFLFLKEGLNRLLLDPSGKAQDEIRSRIDKLFWRKLDYLDHLYNRFVSLITPPLFAGIPLEWSSCEPGRKVYMSRILSLDRFREDPPPERHKAVRLVFPFYKRLPFSQGKEIKGMKKGLPACCEIYRKKLMKTEFVTLLEQSTLFYFSGHSLYSKQRKEYGLRLNDHDIFFFSEFRHCLEVPALLIFNSCFEYRYFERMEEALSRLMEAGCRNIVLPFMPVPQEQSSFMVSYLRLLSEGYPIGEVHYRISRDQAHHPSRLFFRLYGNPMQKYFQKH